MRHADAIENSSVPILLMTGWHDVFLGQTFQQYRRLHERGVDVGLTVGPWTHTDLAGDAAAPMAQQALAWLDDKLAHRAGPARPAPVRLYLTGADTWLGLPQWPKAERELKLFLRPGTLATSAEPAAGATESRFTYNPANPTPTVGGPMIQKGGVVDDSSLTERSDVLAYTGDPLSSDLTVIGSVQIRLDHRSELSDADLFVRLSEVDARGRSRNVTEGYTRLPFDRAGEPVQLNMLPTAHRFRRGNRIRLLVAGGSFPQFARNPGTGENPLTATELHANEHTVSYATGSSSMRLPLG